MKSKALALFIASQVLAGILLTPRSPIALKWMGALLLFPSSALLLLFGSEELAALVMQSLATEILAGVLFFGLNAAFWLAMAVVIERRNRRGFKAESHA